jgi:hypothetical protein
LVRESDVNKDAARAPRFRVEVPLRYRPLGSTRWQVGRIENISRSGVLFRAPDPMEVNTRLEMSVAVASSA